MGARLTPGTTRARENSVKTYASIHSNASFWITLFQRAKDFRKNDMSYQKLVPPELGCGAKPRKVGILRK